MTVDLPGQRADVLAGLDYLAHSEAAQPGDWPDLTNAVHWVVDDTWWDYRDPLEDIGRILNDVVEAEAVRAVVGLLVVVSERQTPVASDEQWLSDKDWPQVVTSAAKAAALFRSDR